MNNTAIFEWMHPEDLPTECIVYTLASQVTDFRSLKLGNTLSKGARDVAAQLATCFKPTASHIGKERIPRNHVIRCGKKGGILIYKWNNGEYISFPIVDGRILLSKGDLDWLHCYPFVKGINWRCHLMEVDMTFFFNDHIQSPSYWVLCRDHFGHLARDTIACYLNLYLKWSEEIRRLDGTLTPASLLHNKVFNSFNKQLLFAAFQVISSRFECKSLNLELPNHSYYITGDLFVPCIQNMPYLVSTYQGELTKPNKPAKMPLAYTKINKKIIYLALDGNPHSRIANRNDLCIFMKDNKISGLPKLFTHIERASYLSQFSIMISDPASSIYNFILYAKPDARCILMLPSFFSTSPSDRDVNDWSCIMYLLLLGRIELLLDSSGYEHNATVPASVFSDLNYRLNDNSYSYDTIVLSRMIESLLNRRSH